MTRSTIRGLLFLLPLLLTTLACAFIADDNTPAAPQATQPPGDLMTYQVPVYSVNLLPGQRVPGTQMYYVNKQDEIYNVTIDGLPAAKQAGDSFSWRGIIGPGVIGRYDLRISATPGSEEMLASGPVEITVLNPVPVELAGGGPPTAGWLQFGNIPVEYLVPKGGAIPGTSLTFEGQTDQGAQLSGTSSYPYRALGDSLIWTGRLRGNAIVRYDLRVSALTDPSMTVSGTAALWINPNT